jgi:hypothetical protein
LNRLPQDYTSEILIEAVTTLDWSQDASAGAVKIIQTSVQERFAESISTSDAVWMLGSLLDRRLIRMQIHPDDANKHGLEKKLRRRAKYVRIPPDEH